MTDLDTLAKLAQAATPAVSWNCWRCEQRNAGWSTVCGRCELERITPERILAMRAVIEAAKAMRRYPTHENSYGRDFDAALAALEGDK